ncbi:MAG: Flp family type IVb pilin [Alphaproteobacteria bacterium CG_4_9_14_3_um_filter_47_13]|nr:MAG: Flp family type IVb pilin [Alphaproteobacteria bacterium CG_4_9_14_3_um_filter_47_13]
MKKLFDWFKNQDGATAIEYAILVSGIALIIIAAFFLTGEDLQLLWSSMGNRMASAAGQV